VVVCNYYHRSFDGVVVCNYYHRSFDGVVAIHDSNWYRKYLNDIVIDKLKKCIILGRYVIIFGGGASSPLHGGFNRRTILMPPLF
jgi:hypothetical protein